MKEINKYKTNQAAGIPLNANENPLNIHEQVLEDIKKALSNVEFNRYPDDECNELKAAYGKLINMPANQIIVGNGSDEMLGLLISLNITHGKKLYTLERDFGMYNYYTSMNDGEVITYPLDLDADFDAEMFCKLGRELDIDLIMFSNPNNPTGKLVKKDDLLMILEAFRDKIVVIDEAYIEFAAENSTMIPYVDKYPNLIVTRTLSKAFGLAAIRCGFMIGNAEMIERIKAYKVPYDVNSVTQMIASIALEYCEPQKAVVEIIKAERNAVYMEIMKLKANNFKVYKSSANYLYGTTKDKAKFLKAFEDAGIKIRNYEDDSFRITIGTHEQNVAVLNVLSKFAEVES